MDESNKQEKSKLKGLFLETLQRNKIYILFALVLLLSIILHLPRQSSVQGYDGFTLIIESNDLLNGFSSFWLVHPLSYLGMVSFSGYPIGSILLFSLILATGLPLEVAVSIYVVIFCVLAGVTSFLLFRYLFEDQRIQLLGVLVYQFLPIVYQFTYNTPTSRAPMLVLAPLFIICLLKWYRTNSTKYFLHSLLLVFMMMLFHRAAFAFGLFIFAVLMVKFISWFANRYELTIKFSFLRTNKFTVILFVAIATILIVSSIAIFGFSPKNSLPASVLPDISSEFLRGLVGFFVDYFLFFGPAVFLSVFSIFSILREIWISDDSTIMNSNNFHLLVMVLPFTFFLVLPAYSRHILAPIVVCLSLYGFDRMKSRLSYLLILFFQAASFAVFFSFYNVFWREIGLYGILTPIILMSLLLIGIYTHSSPSYFKSFQLNPSSETRVKLVTVIIIILVVTLSNSDMRQTNDVNGISIPLSVSDQELAIAEFIRDYNNNDQNYSMIISSNYYLEVRIAAYAEVGCLSDGHGTGILISGYINQDDVLQNSTFSIIENPFDVIWLKYPLSPRNLWFQIMEGNYSDSEIQTILLKLNMKFIIGIKGSNEAFYESGGAFESMFLQTLNAPIVFETRDFSVYELI